MTGYPTLFSTWMPQDSLATWILYILLIANAILLAWYLLIRFRRKVKQETLITERLEESDKQHEIFTEKLKRQVADATNALQANLEALKIKNVELEISHQRAVDSGKIKSEFLANISHELRTPINGIIGFISLMKTTPLNEDQVHYLNTVEESAQSLLSIINNVLDVSKAEAGKMILDNAPFKLRNCVGNVLELLAPIAYARALELVCIIEPDVPDNYFGDSIRLGQILTNLVGNAIKFTLTGSVSVRVRATSQNNNYAVLAFSITDTGIGISDEQRKKLFTAFSQADEYTSKRFGGSGLGLVICRQLLEMMEGKLTLHSTPGLGSTFEFTLPIKLYDLGSEEKQNMLSSRLAIYDSHPLSSQELSVTVNSFCENIQHFSSSTELIALLSASYAENDTLPDAVIIGLSSDEIRNFNKVSEAIAHRDINVEVIVLTNLLDSNELQQIGKRLNCLCLPKIGCEEKLYKHLLSFSKTAENSQQTKTNIPSVENKEAPLSGITVMVADDNTINRRLLVIMLQQAGATVIESSNAQDLLQKIDESHLDVLLLDIHMPGMSGLEVARHIRNLDNQNKNMPIVAVSADALPETRKSAQNAGISDYLVKPVSEETLIRTIGHLYIQNKGLIQQE